MYDVEDAKVSPLIADNATTITYGTPIDVPGIAEVGLDPNLITAELKGDGGRVLAKKGKIDRMNFSATYGKLSLPILQAIMGGATIQAGTTPNQTATYDLAGGTSMPYFRLEFQILDVDLGIGDLHVVLSKCQLTGGTLITGSTDSFGQPSLECEAIGTENGNKMMTVVINETPTAIAVA
ncbi:MAG TPA: hypothetical protein VM386_03990 [Acidimicrobiales bacterium]|nr:hypothetical protein [Acidimicrobiales bacterium]